MWHAGLGLELVEWTCFAPTKRARSHRTSRLSSRSSRSVRLQCKGLLSFALLASKQTQNAEDVIDTMLFRCKQEVQAAFNRHTPHLLRFSFVRWGYALNRSPPACIGCRGFYFAVGPISTLGRSVTLVGPSARCQQRQNLALPNARRGTLHPSR